MFNSLIAQGNIPEGYNGPAQETAIKNPALGGTLNSLLQQGGSAFFSQLIPAAVGLGFLIGAIIFFFMLVVGAIAWISSGGDKQALEAARSRITNALIGIIILFASYAIISLIEAFFHINILTLDIGPLVIQ